MKTLVVLTMLLASFEVFAMGRTDNEIIKEKLDNLKNDGYECSLVYPDNFYESRVPAEGKFDLDYNCKKEGVEKKFSITYKIDGNVNARCRDKHAVLIKEKVKPIKSKNKSESNESEEHEPANDE